MSVVNWQLSSSGDNWPLVTCARARPRPRGPAPSPATRKRFLARAASPGRAPSGPSAAAPDGRHAQPATGRLQMEAPAESGARRQIDPNCCRCSAQLANGAVARQRDPKVSVGPRLSAHLSDCLCWWRPSPTLNPVRLIDDQRASEDSWITSFWAPIRRLGDIMAAVHSSDSLACT